MGALDTVAVTFRLRAVLEEADPPITQAELQRRSGVSMTTINAMVLNKTRQVSLETLDKLCAALSELLGRAVPPGELLERQLPTRQRRQRGA